MTITIVSNARSDVYYKETNLSQVIRNVNNSTGALVMASKKGPLGRKFVSTTKEFIDTYGMPDPTVSFGHYTALQYLKFAPLWINRVVNTDARYGGLIVENINVAGVPVSTSLYNDDASAAALAFTNPDNEIQPGTTEWDTAYGHSGGGTHVSLLAFVPYLGPGAHSKNLKIKLVSKNMKDPGAPTPTLVTGGTLVAGTARYYKITAFNEAGETVANTTAATATPTGAMLSVALSWSPVDGASGYRVYHSTSSGGTFGLLGTAITTEFLDDGSYVTDTTVNPPASSYRTTHFSVHVYDTEQSTVNPVEKFDVSLRSEQDGLGRQMEIEQKINTYSKYVRVYKNEVIDYEAAVGTAQYPYVFNTSSTVFSTGVDGSTPTNTQIANGWTTFEERDLVTVRVLINAGYSNTVVQQKMIAVAEKRKDAVAVLDTPSDKQDAVNAVDYRRNVLNANTTRAALYTPDVKINDPYSDRQLYVPPSGFAAGTYAFTDTVANSWTSPAGLNRGLLDETIGLRYEYNEAERDMLAGSQINYVRKFAGAGNAIWEQLTLASQLSALSYVHVRRLLDVIFVTETEAAKFYVQEPNDDFLARQLVSVIAQFLDGIKNQRGLVDFAVVSNATNNTGAVLNNGQRTVQVFLIPTLAAGKILLESVIGPQGVSAQELIATANAA